MRSVSNVRGLAVMVLTLHRWFDCVQQVNQHCHRRHLGHRRPTYVSWRTWLFLMLMIASVTLYALSLPFMVGSHPPSPFNTELEPESASERKVGGNPEETRLVEEEKPASSLVPGSPARLLKNDGPSPEMGPVGLPRFAGLSRSGTASTLSSVAAPFAPPMSRHSQAVSEYANDTVVANAREVGYWTSSHPSQRSSVAQTVRVPSTLRTDTSHTLSWLGPALPGPSLTPPVHLSEDDADEAQVLIEVNHRFVQTAAALHYVIRCLFV